MKKLQPRDYSRLSNTQAEVMNDLCNIHHISFSSGTYSTKSTEVRTSVTGVACGFQMTNGHLVQRGQTIVVEYDALLRLPANQPVGIADDIELIERGEFVVSGTFKPFSAPIVNSSVQHVQLKRVI